MVGQVRRVLRAGLVAHEAGRSGHDRQHGPRIRRHDGLLSRSTTKRSTTCAAPAAPTPKCNWSNATTRSKALFRTDDAPTPKFTQGAALDLGTVEPSLAGPKRPQDRVALADMKESFRKSLRAPVNRTRLRARRAGRRRGTATVADNGHSAEIGHGAVVIAAITSCTNTSNPSVMLAAGLLAKKAVERGLKVKPYVKTSLAPGSRVVTDYLDEAGLTEPLEKLGFNTVGYGCTTCIGNSGPLPEPVAKAVTEGDLVAAAVLSGNRNFEGRINPLVKANYLASPPLVVAYALAGTTDIDLIDEPLGKGQRRQAGLSEGHLADAATEVDDRGRRPVEPEMFRTRYDNVLRQPIEQWNEIPTSEGELYRLGRRQHVHPGAAVLDRSGRRSRARSSRSHGARVLAALGDSVTTDHISPAGSIAAKSPGRQVLARARRRAGRFQQLRRAPRQRPRDDPRHVRQHPHPQSAGPGHRRGRHAASARRRSDERSTTRR